MEAPPRLYRHVVTKGGLFGPEVEVVPRRVEWYCPCLQDLHGGHLWALHHWLVHMYRWALGRCYYCGDPDCED